MSKLARLAALALALGTRLEIEAAAPTVGSLARAYATLTAPGAASAVSDASFSVGHMKVTLQKGSRVAVKAGEETAGFFFVGEGSFEYQAVDPVEMPVVEFNAKKASSLKPVKGEKSLVLKDRFTELLVLAANVELPPAGAAGLPALENEFKAHRATFDRIQEGPPSHALIAQRLDAHAGGACRIETAGGTDSFTYAWSSVDVPEERLEVIRKTKDSLADAELKKRLWRTLLSSESGRDRRENAIPPFAVTALDYTLRASNGRDASLSVEETIVPVGRPRSVLSFALRSVVFDSSQTGVVNLRTTHVRSVKTADGTPLSFDHTSGSLLVGLPAAAAPDKPFKLSFEIDGDFLVRPQGDNFWLLEGSWVPLPVQTGRLFTMRSTVRVKKPFVPFAPGVTKSRRVEGDENVLETEVLKPIDFPVVLAGNYHYVEETRDGLTVRIASYAMDRPTAFKKLTNVAFGIVKYYEGFLGPFPLPELNIIEINDYGWGQAPPGTLFITQEAFNPVVGDENRLFSGGVNHRFAHEIAHQYWGTVVKRASFEEQWIEESFAEYSAALFIRDAKSKGDYEMLVARWKSRAKLAKDIAPIPLANQIDMPNDPGLESEYRTALLYGKGPYLLSVLHKEIGDDAFFTFLKSYQKSFQWKFGSTKHVAGLLGFLTKKDYGPFFEANYWGMGMPKD